MKQILFFALKDDLVSMIDAAEAIEALKYVRVGNYTNPEIQALNSALDIPDLGRASSGTASTSASYLVCKRDTPVNARPVATAGGASRFPVDQLVNPDSVVFTPAGIWTDEILLHGRLATVSDTAPAQELMKLFNSVVRKRFTKVRAFYVGPQALTWLQAGKRLTISDQSPREFDLVPVA